MEEWYCLYGVLKMFCDLKIVLINDIIFKSVND